MVTAVKDILLAESSDGPKVPLGFLDTANTTKLDGASASAATAAFTAGAVVLITAPEAFHIEIGSNPTASTTSTYLPAGLYETGIIINDKIAIIKATSATNGDVWVTPYR